MPVSIASLIFGSCDLDFTYASPDTINGAMTPNNKATEFIS
jgi:hypothetical protein